MKKYLVYLRQKGQGCDYTLGCGKRLDTIFAQSKEDAIEKLTGLSSDWKDLIKEDVQDGDNVDDIIHDMLADTYLPWVDENSERQLAEVLLIEEPVITDLMPLFKARLQEVRKFQQELHVKSQEKDERAQYERLKKKFEK